MSIPNYGKKLIKDGSLIAESVLLQPHDFQKLWAPDFMESIVYINASKEKYISCLHFFWQSIFHLREVKSSTDVEELLASTHLYKISLEEAKDKISLLAPAWFKENHSLIPQAKWTHVIWNDTNDVFITFEDDEKYYGWGWDSIQ